MEPMNASPHHSKVRVSMTIPDPIFVAGKHVGGKMEVECRADKGLGIGVIMVELFAVQELTSRDHSATSQFLHSSRLFQGPGLPPSNAVQAYPQPGDPPLPSNYYQARRGVSTFLFRIPIPSTCPPSINFGANLAKVRYELRASVGVFWRGERRLVIDKKELDVVEGYEEDFSRSEPESTVVGEFGKIWAQGRVVGGVVISGESACVELQVKNHSNKKNTGLTVTLTRQLHLPKAPPSDKNPLQITDTLLSIPFRGPEYIIPPGVEGVASLVFDIPATARSVKGGLLKGDESHGKLTESIFEVRCHVGVRISMPLGSKDIMLEIPVHIVHPSALPEPDPHIHYALPYTPAHGHAHALPTHTGAEPVFPPYAPFAQAPQHTTPTHSLPITPAIPQYVDLQTQQPQQVWLPPPIPIVHSPQPYAYLPLSPAPQHITVQPLLPNATGLGPAPMTTAHPYLHPAQTGVLPPHPTTHLVRTQSAGPPITTAPAPVETSAPIQSHNQPNHHNQTHYISGLPVSITGNGAFNPHPLTVGAHNFMEPHHVPSTVNPYADHGIYPAPPVEGEEGKGERASRIAQHLRSSVRHRSVSPTSHRYPVAAAAELGLLVAGGAAETTQAQHYGEAGHDHQVYAHEYNAVEHQQVQDPAQTYSDPIPTQGYPEANMAKSFYHRTLPHPPPISTANLPISSPQLGVDEGRMTKTPNGHTPDGLVHSPKPMLSPKQSFDRDYFNSKQSGHVKGRTNGGVSERVEELERMAEEVEKWGSNMPGELSKDQLNVVANRAGEDGPLERDERRDRLRVREEKAIARNSKSRSRSRSRRPKEETTTTTGDYNEQQRDSAAVNKTLPYPPVPTKPKPTPSDGNGGRARADVYFSNLTSTSPSKRQQSMEHPKPTLPTTTTAGANIPSGRLSSPPTPPTPTLTAVTPSRHRKDRNTPGVPGALAFTPQLESGLDALERKLIAEVGTRKMDLTPSNSNSNSKRGVKESQKRVDVRTALQPIEIPASTSGARPVSARTPRREERISMVQTNSSNSGLNESASRSTSIARPGTGNGGSGSISESLDDGSGAMNDSAISSLRLVGEVEKEMEKEMEKVKRERERENHHAKARIDRERERDHDSDGDDRTHRAKSGDEDDGVKKKGKAYDSGRGRKKEKQREAERDEEYLRLQRDQTQLRLGEDEGGEGDLSPDGDKKPGGKKPRAKEPGGLRKREHAKGRVTAWLGGLGAAIPPPPEDMLPPESPRVSRTFPPVSPPADEQRSLSVMIDFKPIERSPSFHGASGPNSRPASPNRGIQSPAEKKQDAPPASPAAADSEATPNPRSSGFVPISTFKRDLFQRWPITKDSTVAKEAQRIAEMWSQDTSPVLTRRASPLATPTATADNPAMVNKPEDGKKAPRTGIVGIPLPAFFSSPFTRLGKTQTIRTDRNVSPPSSSSTSPGPKLNNITPNVPPGSVSNRHRVQPLNQLSNRGNGGNVEGRKQALQALRENLELPAPQKAAHVAPKFPAFPPLNKGKGDPEVKYDVRSARGGRGGKVTAVANLWASGALLDNGNSAVTKDRDVDKEHEKMKRPKPKAGVVMTETSHTPQLGSMTRPLADPSSHPSPTTSSNGTNDVPHQNERPPPVPPKPKPIAGAKLNSRSKPGVLNADQPSATDASRSVAPGRSPSVAQHPVRQSSTSYTIPSVGDYKSPVDRPPSRSGQSAGPSRSPLPPAKPPVGVIALAKRLESTHEGSAATPTPATKVTNPLPRDGSTTPPAPRNNQFSSTDDTLGPNNREHTPILVDFAGKRRNIVKSPSVPAVLSSSHAIPTLSSTASLARPVKTQVTTSNSLAMQSPVQANGFRNLGSANRSGGILKPATSADAIRAPIREFPRKSASMHTTTTPTPKSPTKSLSPLPSSYTPSAANPPSGSTARSSPFTSQPPTSPLSPGPKVRKLTTSTSSTNGATGASSTPKTPMPDAAFGQARLRDLIKKYQGSSS